MRTSRRSVPSAPGARTNVASVPEFTREAQHLLRAPGMFDWSTVTLLALVVYVYAVEVQSANWSAVLAGLAFSKLLPADRSARILGVPNRWALSIALSLVSVGVELLLHADGVFHWYYWWWNVATFPVIVIFGYLTFYVVAFTVYDMPRRARQIQVVGLLAGVNLTAGLVFGPLLGWI
jgi:hypothetical protein